MGKTSEPVSQGQVSKSAATPAGPQRQLPREKGTREGGVQEAGNEEPLPGPTHQSLREIHLFLRLAREWDLRFERLVRIGSVAKWYSSVGNEAITVAAATAIEAGDALATL